MHRVLNAKCALRDNINTDHNMKPICGSQWIHANSSPKLTNIFITTLASLIANQSGENQTLTHQSQMESNVDIGWEAM